MIETRNGWEGPDPNGGLGVGKDPPSTSKVNRRSCLNVLLRSCLDVWQSNGLWFLHEA